MKDPAHHTLMIRPLGATHVKYKALGIYLATQDDNPDFSKVAAFILKQVLSYHYVPLLRLGGYR